MVPDCQLLTVFKSLSKFITKISEVLTFLIHVHLWTFDSPRGFSITLSDYQ